MLSWAQLTQLYMLKGVVLDSQFQELDELDNRGAEPEEKFLTEKAIYNLAATRARLLVQIESTRKEIIIAFHKEYETCLLDHTQERKVEYFTGR